MAKFDDYTQKNTPEDNDITLILDKTANANKKTPFSGSGIRWRRASSILSSLTVMSAPKLYNISHVTSGGHLVFASDGATLAYLASSSRQYKKHVSEMSYGEAEKLLKLPVVSFKYKDGYLAEDDVLNGKAIPGFYAEDVEKIDPVYCQYNENGEVEDWNYRTMIPVMLKLVQDQNKEIESLKTEISKIKQIIAKGENL